ncbi:hypothetical protein UPYG_G00070110, partial [Umbra pygmaea]
MNAPLSLELDHRNTEHLLIFGLYKNALQTSPLCEVLYVMSITERLFCIGYSGLTLFCEYLEFCILDFPWYLCFDPLSNPCIVFCLSEIPIQCLDLACKTACTCVSTLPVRLPAPVYQPCLYDCPLPCIDIACTTARSCVSNRSVGLPASVYLPCLPQITSCRIFLGFGTVYIWSDLFFCLKKPLSYISTI